MNEQPKTIIWAWPTTTSKLPHAFRGIGEVSLCRRYDLQSLVLAEIAAAEPENVCSACKKRAA